MHALLGAHISEKLLALRLCVASVVLAWQQVTHTCTVQLSNALARSAAFCMASDDSGLLAPRDFAAAHNAGILHQTYGSSHPATLAPCVWCCRPIIKRQMEYCRDHPEEISKMVSVQRKVRAAGACIS
jgi:hypothetical protein